MANNRYYLFCPCGKAKYVGKSLGDGVYCTTEDKAQFLEGIHDWMWEHLIDCKRPGPPPSLGPEWYRGEVFAVLTEYDDRITKEALADEEWT